MNDIPRATSHDLLEAALHPHTPRGILYTAASPSEDQFHIMNDLEVSPIIRFPEDYDEHEMMVDNADDNDDKAKKGTATASSANSIQPLLHRPSFQIKVQMTSYCSTIITHQTKRRAGWRIQ
jgi:hypothetical protein